MPQATKAIKTQLEATEDTLRSVAGQSRICNWLYNHLLEKANKLRGDFISTADSEIAKTLYTERGLRNLVPMIKKENSFLKSVHSSPLKNAALRLSHSIRTHQSKKGQRRGGRMGWPKFRSWNAHWFSLLYDEPNKGFKIEGDKLILSLGSGEENKSHTLIFTLKEP